MKFTAQVLSKDEQVRIHEQSLRILSEVGVRIHGEKALPMLKKNGARVDEENRIARIPREMVEEALQRAPGNSHLGHEIRPMITPCRHRSHVTASMAQPLLPATMSPVNAAMAP